MTDSDSLSGVAPVCPWQADPVRHGDMVAEAVEAGVFDCCPQPHLECWSEAAAKRVADALTQAGAETCS